MTSWMESGSSSRRLNSISGSSRSLASSSVVAFSVILNDTLPIYLDNGVIDSALIDGTTDVSGSLDITADLLSTVGDLDLALGSSLVIEISTTVNDDTDVGQEIDNTATLQWSSLDNGLDGDEAGISDGVNDERTGAGPNPPNDYADQDNVIKGLERVSRPGLRNYVGAGEVPRVLGGLGVAILSTSSGVVSDREARKQKVGGELLCKVW